MYQWLSTQTAAVVIALMLTVSGISAAFAEPQDFRLVNNSGRDIAEIYVAPSNVDEWGENLISDGEVLPHGNKMPIAIKRIAQGGCYYAIKIVTTDGDASELNRVDLCNTLTVTHN